MAKTEEGHGPYGKMNKDCRINQNSDHRFTNSSAADHTQITDPTAHNDPCLLVLLLSIKKSCSFSIPHVSIYHFSQSYREHKNTYMTFPSCDIYSFLHPVHWDLRTSFEIHRSSYYYASSTQYRRCVKQYMAVQMEGSIRQWMHKVELTEW